MVVLGTYRVVLGSEDNNSWFFHIYRTYALLFHTGSVIIFYFMLIRLKRKRFAFWGAVIFALLPAMFMAYNLPVHTREDTLAYILLCSGILAIEQNRSWAIVTFCILGLLCRETLLILPLINLVFNDHQDWFKRIGTFLISGLAFLGVRIFLGGDNTPYDFWEGLRWNLNHLMQVASFGFVTFGFLWATLAHEVFSKTPARAYNTIIDRSSRLAAVLIVTTTCVGGIFNEIRILYLLAPWAIVSGIDVHMRTEYSFGLFLRSRFIIVSILISIFFCTIGISITYADMVAYAKSSVYEVPYNAWISIGWIQVFLSLLLISFAVFNSGWKQRAIWAK